MRRSGLGKPGCILMISVLLSSCGRHKDTTLFTLIQAGHSHIDFVNKVDYTEEYNTYTYRNFYNGAGTGIGDINNDGLPDIFFCGNMAGNRLYLNKGNLVFEDITKKSGLGGASAWSTGVSMADINGDGLIDIYVCKSGRPDTENRSNQLFINNGDLTFTDKAAEYGINVMGLSSHASFFDYDRDGDLDCYLLNNSFTSVTEFDVRTGQREIRDTLGGNRLYRNDNGHFKDVSREAGIYGSKIGFGLGVSVADVNRDGWPDIYVSNDFFERDYLYINKGDGTFRECLEEEMTEISLGAMGADVADVNNDTYPDIFVTEMTPEDIPRYRTKALFEDWDRYSLKLSNGYYRQFARNTLQINNGNGSFSETGRLSGVSHTDWSWGALIFDMDNDGWKDIFVANGIFKDLLDRDYLDVYSNPSMMRTLIQSDEKAILTVIDKIPSVRISNYAFHNNRDLTFSNLSDEWGLSAPSWSNGAAYGDLDNDGDLDLVVNNVNMPPFLFRNEADQKTKNHFIEIELKGSGNNEQAIGASATIYYNGNTSYGELVPARGFQSSSDTKLHFGLGSATSVDSLEIMWPDGLITQLKNIEIDKILKLSYADVVKRNPVSMSIVKPVFQPSAGAPYSHVENDFNDFERDRLLFRMVSDEGPHMAVADVDGNGLEDIFICGAKDSPGALFIQREGGKFEKTNTALFEADKISEDTDCEFFDADNDGDADLYVASGGNEFPSSSSALADRLYINDGKGRFSKSQQILPCGKFESTSCIDAADFDGDGDLDLFAGIRLLPFEYGLPANGYLLENDGKGKFSNVTQQKAPALLKSGMITGMKWADVDNDNDPDMIIAGDWMPVRIMINNKGSFTDESERYGLKNTEGIWHRIEAADLNGDGYIDFILGNEGLNTGFSASTGKPMTMYINDFDLNGTIEQVICTFKKEKSFPMALKDDIVIQIPSLVAKYKTNHDYQDQSIEDIFSPEVLKRSFVLKAKILESCVLMNSGKNSFTIIPLPLEAQISPVYAILAGDFDGDGNIDLLLGGNQSRAKPESGINLASYGLMLKGDGNSGWKSLPVSVSGIFVKGEIRDFVEIKINNSEVIGIARNNDSLLFYKH